MEANRELLETLTRVSTALQDREVSFALTGGCAIYARGGPLSYHDVDVLVRHEDVDAALGALADVGMNTRDPAENWLAKAYDDGRLVDLIHRPNEEPVTDETLGRAQRIRVGPVSAPVMPATDLLVEKLLTLGPHRCDLTEVLPTARAIREQVDWGEVERLTASSPYAEAFLLLVRRLGISGGAAGS